MNKVLRSGTPQEWHFVCPLCGHEWTSDDLYEFSVGEVVMPGSYEYRVFQASSECENCGLLVNSETKQIPKIKDKEDSEDDTAEWIDKEVRGTMTNVCSKCGGTSVYPVKYCGNCGIAMRNGY